MVLQRWCIFKAALKSFTVLRVACTFGLLGPSAGPAASKTDCSGQQRPLSFSTPQSTSPIVYERLLLLGCIQKHEKTQGPGCAEASKVKRAQGWGEWGGGWGEKRKAEIPLIPRWCFPDSSSDSFSGRASEVSNQRGNWRERREEENRILEGTRHLRTE